MNGRAIDAGGYAIGGYGAAQDGMTVQPGVAGDDDPRAPNVVARAMAVAEAIGNAERRLEDILSRLDASVPLSADGEEPPEKRPVLGLTQIVAIQERLVAKLYERISAIERLL